MNSHFNKHSPQKIKREFQYERTFQSTCKKSQVKITKKNKINLQTKSNQKNRIIIRIY